MASANFLNAASASIVTFVTIFLNALFYFIHILFYDGKVEKNSNTKIVVITGCDSGFGLIASELLTSLGYQVVSVCLSQEGVERLRGSVAMALKCDVTIESDVTKMAADVEKYTKEQKQKLFAVINNAGILALGAVEWCPVSSYQKVMAVNFFGAVMVTKAMIPLLKANRGSRFIYISSVAGMHTFALGSAYFASKHALEGFTKTFRQEMTPWGVHVCNINPSFTR
jgi:NAD(P)-dependent dehydrogenase (short-subunit alcohol dehydrogenase family)